MTEFVYGGATLLDGKSDNAPLSVASDKGLVAAEWNETQQFLDDLRNAIKSGTYHGLSQSSETVSAANKAKIRLSTGNVLQSSVNGGAWTSLGAITLGAFSATGSSGGLTLTGSILNLDPATATQPGGVSILAQAFAGDKRFAGNVSIGTITPTFPFDLFKSNAGLAVGRVINSAADGLSAFRFLDSGGADGLIVGVGNGGAPAPYTSLNFIAATQGTISFLSNGAVNATLTQAGIFAPVGGLNLPTGAPLYSNGSAGTAGYLLTSGGAGAVPTWAANPNSGTNTGDVTLAAFGSTPNANAASLTGQALTLQPASTSYGGGVSTIAQTFAGAKSFVDAAIFNSTRLEGIAASILGVGSGRVHYSTRTSDGNYGRLVVRGRSTAGVAIGATGASASSIQYVGTLTFYSQTIGELDTATPTGSGTQVLSITSGGNVTLVGNVTVDTDTLFVDATNNRVGMGNTAPVTLLDLTDSVAAATLLNIKNLSSTGFSGITFKDSTGAIYASMGYGNAGTAAPYTSVAYIDYPGTFHWIAAGTTSRMTLTTAGLLTPAAGIDLNASGALLKTGGSAGTTNQALLSTGASTRPAWTTIPLESNSSAAVFQYGAQALLSTDTTEIIHPGYNAAAGSNTDPNVVGWIVPYAGVASKLYVKANTGPVGDSTVFTVYKNNVATTLTCTMAAAATSASDTSNSFSVAAGDELTLKSNPGASISSGALNVRANLRVTLA